jgi:cytochrome c551/c552
MSVLPSDAERRDAAAKNLVAGQVVLAGCRRPFRRLFGSPRTSRQLLRRVLNLAFGVAAVVMGGSLPKARVAAQDRVYDVPRTERLTYEQEEALASGLIGRFSQGGQLLDARRFRLPALWTADTLPATPWLKPGPFELTLEGFLLVELPDEFRFQFEGNGTSRLEFNGLTVAQAAHDNETRGSAEVRVRLPAGYQRIAIYYRSPPHGEASFRWYWQGQQFPREPLPPTILFHLPSDPQLVRAEQLRQGRELFANRNCHRCHDESWKATSSSAHDMPELHRANPDLWHTARELHSDWIANWLLEPTSLRNRVTMPELIPVERNGQRLEIAERRQMAADLARFLVDTAEQTMTAGLSATSRDDRDLQDSGQVKSEQVDTEQVDTEQVDTVQVDTVQVDTVQVEAGEVLFENLGCIACHHFTLPAADDVFGRISLHFVGAKFAPGGLARYLQAPRRYYPSSRMPDFSLTAGEAKALAAFLRSRAGGTVGALAEAGGARPERGRIWFAEFGCGACHESSELAKSAPSTGSDLPPVAELIREGPIAKSLPIAIRDNHAGCLAIGSPAGSSPQPDAAATELASRAKQLQAPRYVWQPGEREAVVEFLASGRQSLRADVDAEFAGRFVQRQQCQMCHELDGQAATWGEALAEEGTQGTSPETVPPLTWAGEKLRTGWMQRQIGGTLGYRARPWLKARMPSFGRPPIGSDELPRATPEPSVTRPPGLGQDERFPASDEEAELRWRDEEIGRLARGLAAQHGYDSQGPARPAGTAEQIQIGFELTQQAKGFYCIECHAVGKQPAAGAFAHQGVNFHYVGQRLHYPYFRRWILDPLRVDPNSKMPKFSADGVASPKADFYAGDAPRQFDAVWHYLMSVEVDLPDLRAY